MAFPGPNDPKITFKGKLIECTPGLGSQSPREIQAIRRNYWGQPGQTEIRGQPGGRQVTVNAWLHGEYETLEDWERAVGKIEKLLNKNGKLFIIVDAIRQQEFDNATFEQFVHVPLPGQAEAVPLLDVAGTVDEGWFSAARLVFWIPKGP